MLRHSFVPPILWAFVLSAAFVMAHAQTTPPADTKPVDAKLVDTKLALNAALVLTPEFCATKTKMKNEHQTLETGKVACAELEEPLKGVFSSVTRVAAASSPGEAQVVLLPRLVDVDAAMTMGYGNREMVVLLEWTVKDMAGRTVWIETVQGSAQHHLGNMATYGKNLKLILNDSVKDAAKQSAIKMSASPELRKLSQ